MSKIAAANKIRIEDENNAVKFGMGKKFGVSTTDQTKRAALGDLQNRAFLRAANSAKDVALKTSTDKPQAALRNIKARVDTHRKKSSIEDLAHAESTSTATSVSKKPLAASNVAQRKVVTRANSMRLGTGLLGAAAKPKPAHGAAGIVGASGRVEGGTGAVLAGQKPKTTVTAKVVEHKVQHVKYVSKSTEAISTTSSTATGVVSTTLRREDSKLSRKCLSQLKAVLQRDATYNVTAKPVAKVAALPKDDKEVTSTTTDVQSTKIAAIPAAAGEGKQLVAAKTSAVAPKPAAAVHLSHTNRFLSAYEVEDIDSGDGENLILVSEYVNDIYDYLFSLEDVHAIRENFLKGQLEIHPKTRAVLMDWINEVHLQFRLVGDTFQIAVAIIDRYLQTVDDTKRSLLQLVGVTALFIAAKYEELFPPTIADFVYITDNTYDARQILLMEVQIFKALDCNLSRPLPLHFLRRFSKAADAEEVVHGMAKYLVELSLIEYELSWCKPSEIAAASLFLTLHLLRGNSKLATGFNNKHWNPTLEWYSRYTADYLKPTTRKIATIARNAPNVKLKAVYNKYQTSKFQKLSLRAELYSPLMDSIINSQ